MADPTTLRPTAWAIPLVLALFVPALVDAQSGAPSAEALPEAIPLFPLPDVALFPNSTEPFHIFEPRYRAMVADALEGDSIIGMVLLQPGFEDEYEGRPPVYAVGCAGVIVASEKLPDGRYNILLRGVTKFRILSEDQSQLYRVASVEELPEPRATADRSDLAATRQEVVRALRAAFPGAQSPPSDLSDEEVIDALALMLPIEPAERQDLLEADGSIERAAKLIEILHGRLSAAD